MIKYTEKLENMEVVLEVETMEQLFQYLYRDKPEPDLLKNYTKTNGTFPTELNSLDQVFVIFENCEVGFGTVSEFYGWTDETKDGYRITHYMIHEKHED